MAMTDMSVDSVLEKSDELRRAGEYVEAIMLLTDTLDDHSDARLYFSRGRHFWLDNQPELAVVDFTRAIELDPNESRYYFHRGHVLSYELDRKNQAIDDFEKTLELKPDDGEAHRECCAALLMMLRPERAWEHAKAALRLLPGEAETHFYMGQSQMALKRFGDAAKSFTRAVELEPESANYWSSLAHARRKLDGKADLEAAERAYSQAIRLDPNSAGYFYSRGALRLQLGRVEDAIVDFRQALALKPSEATLMLTNIDLEEAEKLSREGKQQVHQS